LPEDQATISEEYTTIPKKFCDDNQVKEARSKANKASTNFSLKTGSSLTFLEGARFMYNITTCQ
jgi:hypothetical protein